MVYFQRRRLTPIEKGQPDVIKITAEEITYDVPIPPSELFELSPATVPTWMLWLGAFFSTLLLLAWLLIILGQSPGPPESAAVLIYQILAWL